MSTLASLLGPVAPVELLLGSIVVELAVVLICLRRLIALASHTNHAPLRFVLFYDPLNALADKFGLWTLYLWLTAGRRERKAAERKAKALAQLRMSSPLDE